MKNRKRFLAALLSCLLVFAAVPVAWAEEAATEPPAPSAQSEADNTEGVTTSDASVDVSQIIKIKSDWKGSIFGDISGEDVITPENFGIVENDDGTVTIKVANDKGKISSNTEGIAYYYKEIPENSDFKLSAKVKVDAWTANNQVSFGIMARGNILENQYQSGFTGDHVAIGALNQSIRGFIQAGETRNRNWNTFDSASPAEGKEYEFSLERVGNTFTLKNGETTKVLENYEGTIKYIGLYAARNTTVTFSNIELVLPEPELVKITVDATNMKKEYNIGETLDLTGLVVTAEYSDNTTKVIPVEELTITGFDSSKEGKVELKIEYKGLSETLEITIKAAPEQPPVDVSEIIKIKSDWKGSIFGDISYPADVSIKPENFEIVENDDNTVTIRVSNNTGKISDNTEGIAYYYKEVAPDADFKLSAKVKVDAWTANNQVSFGIMARGNLLENQYQEGFTGDHVAVGALRQGMKGFYQAGEDRNRNWYSFKADAPAQDKEYVLSLEKSGNTFTLTIGDETAKLENYAGTIQYVGLYAARNTTVTFSDIKLEVGTSPVQLVKITVDATNMKTAYKVGEELDLTGLVVTAEYSDNTTKVIPVEELTITGFDSSKEGKIELKIEYGGVSATLELTITAETPAPTPPPASTAPRTTTTVAGNSILITASSSIGGLNAFIDSLQMNQAIQNAQQSGSKEVLIDVSDTLNTSYEFVMPAQPLAVDDGEYQVTVKTRFGTVSLPASMFAGTDMSPMAQITLRITKPDVTGLPQDVRNAIGSRPVIGLEIVQGGKEYPFSNLNAPVTVTLPYQPIGEESANPEFITVWYIDGEGQAIPVPSARYDASSGTVTFMTTHFSTFAVTYVKKSFNDLGSVPWAVHMIEVLGSKGVIEDAEASYFPNEAITRGEFLAYLMRALGLTAAFDSNFDDVDPDAFYYDEIGMARALGIAEGVDDRNYRPDSTITRQEVFALTARALRVAGLLDERTPLADLAGFGDHGQLAGYAVADTQALVALGLVEGDHNKMLLPLSNMTRAEAAALIYRVFNM